MINLPPRKDISEEPYIRIAVELLQTQNPTAIFMLKQFLTYIPSPTRIKSILTAAIAKLVDTSPAAICWLLKHPDSLQPEINISQTVIQILSSRLINMGFVQGQDFSVDTNQNFKVNEVAQLALSTRSQLFEIQDPSLIVDYLQKKS
jgi:hypothetical protein